MEQFDRRGLAQLRRDGELRLSARLPFPVFDHQPDRRRAYLLWRHQGLPLATRRRSPRCVGFYSLADHVRRAMGRRPMCSASSASRSTPCASPAERWSRSAAGAVDVGRYSPRPQGPRARRGAGRRRRSDAARVLPLTLPFTTGPGTIAVAITIGAERPSNGVGLLRLLSRREHRCRRQRRDHLDLLSLRRSADRVHRADGAAVIVRLTAFLLMCIGVQIWSPRSATWSASGASFRAAPR